MDGVVQTGPESETEPQPQPQPEHGRQVDASTCSEATAAIPEDDFRTQSMWTEVLVHRLQHLGPAPEPAPEPEPEPELETTSTLDDAPALVERPKYPLLFRRGAAHGPERGAELQLNTCEAIETELFSGHALFRLPGHPGTEHYWASSGSKSRANSVVIQGRFKYRIPFSDVYTGQHFDQALQIDHLRGVRLGIEVVRRISPLLEANVAGCAEAVGGNGQSATYFLSPLAPTAKRMHVCAVDSPDVPELGPGLILHEHTQLLGGRFARTKDGKSIPHKKRRSYFNSSKALAKYWFEPSLLYTFDFFSAGPDFAEFEFKILNKSIDLARVLNGQPVQFMATIMPSTATAQSIVGTMATASQPHDDRGQGREGGHGQAEDTSHQQAVQQPLHLWQLEVLHERQLQNPAQHGHEMLQGDASTCTEESAALPEEDDELAPQSMWTEVLEHRWQHLHGSGDAAQSIYE